MSSTSSETLTHEHATVGPALAEKSHFARMAALYAWILVTLAIFVLAVMLAGMEDRQVAAGHGGERTESVGAVDRLAP